MAAIDITIRSTSLADLEATVAQLHQRFQAADQPGATPVVGLVAESAVGQAIPTKPRTARGAGKASGNLVAPTHSEAAGDEQAAATGDDQAGIGGGSDLVGADDGALGDTGPVAAEEAADTGLAGEAQGAQAGQTADVPRTLDDVKKASQALAKAPGKGVKAVQAVLATFNVAKFPLIPVDKFAEVIEAMDAARVAG